MNFKNAFMKRKIALAGLIVLCAIVAMAVFAPWVATKDPTEMSPIDKLMPPGQEHVFGTDNFGRDVFSRVVFGARTSLVGAAGIVVFSLVLGILVGIMAGWFRPVEAVLMRITDVLMAFPPLLLGLVLVSILGRGLGNVIIAVGATYLTRTARIVYGLTLKLREEPYVEAARCCGVRESKILLRHIIPNMTSPLIVQMTFVFAFSLLEMAALDFLGLGVPVDIPSWGNMLSEGSTYISRAPWILLFPGAMIMLCVLGFNLVGDVLRDQLDPHFRRDIEGV